MTARVLRRPLAVAVLAPALLLSLTVDATSAQARAVRGPGRPGPLSVQSVATVTAIVSFGRAVAPAGVQRYQVIGNGRVVASTTQTADVVVRLHCGTTYTLGARAVDRRGQRSRLSPVAHLRTHACLDDAAPQRPSAVRLVSRTSTGITISWAPATDPHHGRVRQYVLTRNGRIVGGTHATSYRFTRLLPAQPYRLGVLSRDAVGNLSPAAAVVLSTARPPQSTGTLRPFVLATDSASVQDAEAHYQQLQWIFPTYFQLSSQGYVSGSDQPALTRWFQLRGVKVLPRFHSEDSAYVEKAATDPAARAALVSAIAGAVHDSGFDGASLDLEPSMPTSGIDGLTKQQRWDRLRAGFTALVTQLADALHSQGKLLSVDVAANWCSQVDPLSRVTTYCASSTDPSATTRPRPYLYDYRALAQVSDELWLLAWGLHWSTSEPGAIAGLPWLTAVGNYFTDLFAGRADLMAKLTLGVQLYGFDWQSQTVRTDTVPMPGAIPAAPSCSATSSVKARPVFQYDGDGTGGTLTVTWTCNLRAALPLEYADVVREASVFGVSPTWDAASQEETFSVPDPDQPGAVRTAWFADARSVRARDALAAGFGWHLGLWRLGREDQHTWDAPSIGVSP